MPLDIEKDKEIGSTQENPEWTHLANTLILAQWDSFWTSDLQNYLWVCATFPWTYPSAKVAVMTWIHQRDHVLDDHPDHIHLRLCFDASITSATGKSVLTSCVVIYSTCSVFTLVPGKLSAGTLSQAGVSSVETANLENNTSSHRGTYKGMCENKIYSAIGFLDI